MRGKCIVAVVLTALGLLGATPAAAQSSRTVRTLSRALADSLYAPIGAPIIATTCTNQFISAIAATGAGTCTAFVLAGAQFANQGTTSTVLHGNAAGNPTWAAVALATEVSGTLPVANGGTGNTTGTATINANLTGPITSVGNATAIAAQTGTGSVFAMQTNPAFVGPTSDTLQTSSNVGVGTTPNATTGRILDILANGNQNTIMEIKNGNAGSSAVAMMRSVSDTASARLIAYPAASASTAFGVTLAGWSSFDAPTGAGMVLGTTANTPLRIGTVGVAAIIVDTSQNVSITAKLTPSQTSGIVGTTTNNDANAGSFGEFKTAVCPGPATTSTITVTIASPGVVTWTSHPFSGTAPRFDACPVVFTTSGALPTGITAGTNYWVIPTTISGNNFSIATSVANAIAGTAINTTGSQSGTQTGTAGTVLATGATKDVTGFALTAGDWDCSGANDFTFGATTSYTNLVGSISTIAATLGGQDTGFDYETAANVPTATADMTWRIGNVRQLLSGTTNVFFVAQATFTVSTLKTYGTLRCRRMR